MLLEAPPVTGTYGTLKTFLLRLVELSELEKADRLLSLGDGKPSELMERMLAVLGSADPALLFTHIFMRQLLIIKNPPKLKHIRHYTL